MLTVEIRVNGSIVTVISAVNRGIEHLDTNQMFYRYEYQGATIPLDNKGPVESFNGFVEHIRSDGLIKLIQLLLNKIPKE